MSVILVTDVRDQVNIRVRPHDRKAITEIKRLNPAITTDTDALRYALFDLAHRLQERERYAVRAKRDRRPRR